jgi:hypothetical protein
MRQRWRQRGGGGDRSGLRGGGSDCSGRWPRLGQRRDAPRQADRVWEWLMEITIMDLKTHLCFDALNGVYDGDAEPPAQRGRAGIIRDRENP